MIEASKTGRCEFYDVRDLKSSGDPKPYKRLLIKLLDSYERIDKLKIEIEGIKK